MIIKFKNNKKKKIMTTKKLRTYNSNNLHTQKFEMHNYRQLKSERVPT